MKKNCDQGGPDELELRPREPDESKLRPGVAQKLKTRKCQASKLLYGIATFCPWLGLAGEGPSGESHEEELRPGGPDELELRPGEPHE